MHQQRLKERLMDQKSEVQRMWLMGDVVVDQLRHVRNRQWWLRWLQNISICGSSKEKRLWVPRPDMVGG